MAKPIQYGEVKKLKKKKHRKANIRILPSELPRENSFAISLRISELQRFKRIHLYCLSDYVYGNYSNNRKHKELDTFHMYELKCFMLAICILLLYLIFNSCVLIRSGVSDSLRPHVL